MLLTYRRWAKRILLVTAALPLLQTTGCDPYASVLQLGTGVAGIIANSLTQTLVQSAIQTLLGMFPGSNILRALFINAGFFPGL